MAFVPASKVGRIADPEPLHLLAHRKKVKIPLEGSPTSYFGQPSKTDLLPPIQAAGSATGSPPD